MGETPHRLERTDRTHRDHQPPALDELAQERLGAVVGSGGDNNGVVGRVLTTATVFNGPSNSFDIRGTVPSGATVSVSGRNDDGSWLQIVYPPNSTLRGWVEVDLVEVTYDIMLLAIAEAGAPPAIDIPTSVAPAATSTPVVTATPVATDTPAPTIETATQPPPTAVATPPPTITPPPSETAEETPN